MTQLVYPPDTHHYLCTECNIVTERPEMVCVFVGYNHGHSDAAPDEYAPQCPQCECTDYMVPAMSCSECGEYFDWTELNRDLLCEKCAALNKER